MNSDKKGFLVNATIIPLYNIVLSIFLFIQTKGETFAFAVIVPTVIFLILFILTLLTETNFTKKSYKISHLFNYVAIVASLLIFAMIYSIENNRDPSPGGGFILVIMALMWIVPIVIAFVSYMIGYLSKSEPMNVQDQNKSKLSKIRSLFLVINSFIGLGIVMNILYIIRDANSSRIIPNYSSPSISMVVLSAVSLITTFIMIKKPGIAFKILQTLTIVFFIVLVY